MANFQTHLNVGIVVSAATTLSLHMAGLVPVDQTMTLFSLGVVGSLLPDIDCDTSKPVNALFSVLGAGLAFAMTLPLSNRFLPMDLALIWVGVFLCVRYGFFEIFARFTVHRGIWHSWLGIWVAMLGAADLAYWMWHQSPGSAWVAGLVVGIGYLTHLCLDEFSSVDLFNTKVKRSFGTALKPFCLASPWSSLGMVAIALALVWLAPPADEMLRRMRLPRTLELTSLQGEIQHGVRWAVTRASGWWSQLARLLEFG